MKVLVLFGGTWGTTLAWLLAEKGHHVTLAFHSRERFTEAQNRRRNAKYLPDLFIPENVEIVHGIPEAWPGDLAIFAIPSRHFREVVRRVREKGVKAEVFVNASKGVLWDGGIHFLSEVGEELTSGPWVCLSGPNLAQEILNRLPAVCVVGGKQEAAGLVVRALEGSPMRPYWNPDRRGVELGGAWKNILAIAMGACDGLTLGANARGALVARGVAEMLRFADAVGAKKETLYGIAGLGDIIATGTSPRSRNYSLGFQLARGKSLDEALLDSPRVAEGMHAVRHFRAFAREKGIRAPITEAVHGVLYDGWSVEQALRFLLDRPVRGEWEY